MATKFVPMVSVLEIANQGDLEDYVVKLFYWKLSYRGGTEKSRCFPDWKTKKPGFHSHLKVGSTFSLYKINPKWLDRLVWIRDKAMAPVGIKMLYEVTDGCAQRQSYGWSSWCHNIEGIRNVWEMSEKSLKAWKYNVDAVYEALGDSVDYSLVNEASLSHADCSRWTYDRAEYMRSKGMVRPEIDRPSSERKFLYFSGSIGPDGTNCGHRMHGTLSDEVPDDIQPIPYQWPNDGAIRMIHNVGKPEQVPDLFTGRKLRHQFSTDGCNFKDEPPKIKGWCELIDGKEAWCGPSGSSMRKTIIACVAKWGSVPRWGNLFDSYETLPREIQKEGRIDLSAFDWELNCRPFIFAYKAVYKVYPKNWHKYPKPKP